MANKRKRIKTQGTFVAWSNGNETHIIPSQLKQLRDHFDQQIRHYHFRVRQGYEWETDDPALFRGESSIMEQHADRLWSLGHHVASLQILMDAALHLIDWDIIYPGPDFNYYHRNFARYRYLISRCMERVRQDPRLETLFFTSPAYSLFLEIERHYDGHKANGWIP